jgi:hypothetical protein
VGGGIAHCFVSKFCQVWHICDMVARWTVDSALDRSPYGAQNLPDQIIGRCVGTYLVLIYIVMYLPIFWAKKTSSSDRMLEMVHLHKWCLFRFPGISFSRDIFFLFKWGHSHPLLQFFTPLPNLPYLYLITLPPWDWWVEESTIL